MTALVDFRAAPAASTDWPRRVLVISADMGGGHNATADALEESARLRWPRGETRRLDTLDMLGPGVGRLFRSIYVSNVEQTPWLYEFFYSSLWRHRWFAHASKRLTGSWSGRRLVAHLDRFDPDLIVSTYPLGSAGLEWLRRHRGLSTPVAAYVSDFAPHPFWIYRDLDANFVVHETAVPLARAAEPGAVVGVCAAPVVRRFRPGDRPSARRATGLREDAFVVLVSCGAYAFGDVVATVRALLEASPQVQVVAACGRNQSTFRSLSELGQPSDRLVPLAWRDDMPEFVRAADVVLTNAGGATALEALATGRPLIMSNPIAAHGAANANLMVVAGLADVCSTSEALTKHVEAVVEDRASLGQLERHASEHAAGHELSESLGWLAAQGGRRPEWSSPERPSRDAVWPMRPSDVFFAHVDHGSVRQELGAVLELEDITPGVHVTLDDVRALLVDRMPRLPPLRRRMVRRPRPGWVQDTVDLDRHVAERTADPDVPGLATVGEALGRFWSEPLPRDRPAWQVLLVHAPLEGRTVLAVKMHHAYADGVSALGVLDRLVSLDAVGPAQAPPSARPARVRAPGPSTARRGLACLRQGRLFAGGLVSLASRGRPPAHPLNRPIVAGGRQLVTVPLPAQALRRLAREHRAGRHEIVLAVLADALGRALGDADLVERAAPLRVMVPVAMRAPRLGRVFGNWTGTVALDLPLQPMRFGRRLDAVRSELRLRMRRGEPQAAQAVMRAAGHLPVPVHGFLARLVYQQRFFNAIVSYMPVTRREWWCAGARVCASYPVLPLAQGVPLTVGVIDSGETAGVGILLDGALGLSADSLTAAVLQALAEAEDCG